MNLKSAPMRRRGAALQQALLEAAWSELVEVGYAAMTFEGVADRASTSRPVVYRRWATKPDMARAAIGHYYENTHVEVPDTGSLRSDVIELLETLRRQRGDVVAVLTVGLAAYFEETGTQLADLRSTLLRSAPPLLTDVLRRAADRGEIPTAAVSPRIATIPFDLLRNELLFGPTPTLDTVESIVDEVFLPLVHGSGG